MVSLHKVTTVLNYLYGLVGIYWLIGTVGGTIKNLQYGLKYAEWPNIYCYVITLMIFATFFQGKAALVKNDSKKKLRRFAGLVLFGLLLQFIADYTMEENSLDRLVALFKGIANMPASCLGKLKLHSLFGPPNGASKNIIGENCLLNDTIVHLLSRPFFAVLVVVLPLALIADAVQLFLIMFALIIAQRVSDENVRSQTV